MVAFQEVLPSAARILYTNEVETITNFSDLSRIGYVSMGGGALVRFLTGIELPLVQAMKKACQRWGSITRETGLGKVRRKS